MDQELRIWLIVLVCLFVVAIGIVIAVLLKNNKFQKTFNQGKFSLLANVYKEPGTDEKRIELVLANKTISPICVSSVGLLYNNERIELIDILYNDINLPRSEALYCNSRNQLKLVYDYQKYYDLFEAENKLKKIQFFVMDDMGNESIMTAKNVRKNIIQDHKLIEKQRKLAKKNGEAIEEFKEEKKIEEPEEEVDEFEQYSDSVSVEEEE